jgi:hypothetical protein
MKSLRTVSMLTTGAIAVSVTSAAVAWGAVVGGPAGPGDQKAAPSEAAAQAPPVYQPSHEDHVVSMSPCRLVKTSAAHGRIGKGKSRRYHATGTTGFPSQGGVSGGCGIPAGATSITATLVASQAKKPGSIKAISGGSTPKLVTLSYSKAQTSGSATIALNEGDGTFTVKNVGGPVNLTVGVTGYTVKPLAGFISSSGQSYSGSSRILNSTRISTGVYEVQFDRNIRYCSATTTPYVSAYLTSVSTWYDSARPDTARVWVWSAGGAPVDQYFYIQVEC